MKEPRLTLPAGAAHASLVLFILQAGFGPVPGFLAPEKAAAATAATAVRVAVALEGLCRAKKITLDQLCFVIHRQQAPVITAQVRLLIPFLASSLLQPIVTAAGSAASQISNNNGASIASTQKFTSNAVGKHVTPVKPERTAADEIANVSSSCPDLVGGASNTPLLQAPVAAYHVVLSLWIFILAAVVAAADLCAAATTVNIFPQPAAADSIGFHFFPFVVASPVGTTCRGFFHAAVALRPSATAAAPADLVKISCRFAAAATGAISRVYMRPAGAADLTFTTPAIKHNKRMCMLAAEAPDTTPYVPTAGVADAAFYTVPLNANNRAKILPVALVSTAASFMVPRAADAGTTEQHQQVCRLYFSRKICSTADRTERACLVAEAAETKAVSACSSTTAIQSPKCASTRKWRVLGLLHRGCVGQSQQQSHQLQQPYWSTGASNISLFAATLNRGGVTAWLQQRQPKRRCKHAVLLESPILGACTALTIAQCWPQRLFLFCRFIEQKRKRLSPSRMHCQLCCWLENEMGSRKSCKSRSIGTSSTPATRTHNNSIMTKSTSNSFVRASRNSSSSRTSKRYCFLSSGGFLICCSRIAWSSCFVASNSSSIRGKECYCGCVLGLSKTCSVSGSFLELALQKQQEPKHFMSTCTYAKRPHAKAEKRAKNFQRAYEEQQKRLKQLQREQQQQHLRLLQQQEESENQRARLQQLQGGESGAATGSSTLTQLLEQERILTGETEVQHRENFAVVGSTQRPARSRRGRPEQQKYRKQQTFVEDVFRELPTTREEIEKEIIKAQRAWRGDMMLDELEAEIGGPEALAPGGGNIVIPIR